MKAETATPSVSRPFEGRWGALNTSKNFSKSEEVLDIGFLLMPLAPKYQPPWKLVCAIAPQRLVSTFHLSPSLFSKLYICSNHFLCCISLNSPSWESLIKMSGLLYDPGLW